MNLKNRIVALVAATAIAVPAVAFAYSMKAGDGKTPMAYFKANLNAGGAVIDGKTADITLSDDQTNIVLKVDLGRVNTGMKLRNEHFQSKFLGGKKSTAQLTVKKADVAGKKSGEVDGKLKLNEKERSVKVNFKVEDIGDRLKVTASVRDPNASPDPDDKDTKIKGINYADFGWQKMCYLGVCVKNDVVIRGELYTSKE